ncbi:MAG: sulfatase-like hydrolase/transferase, partial [Planctomycetes bacterium]|nr:sulfatase-like hydrolase/transferase [Planctomycetota bacterium]
MSIVAFTGHEPLEPGIEDFADLEFGVPSLGFLDNRNTKFVNIRGRWHIRKHSLSKGKPTLLGQVRIWINATVRCRYGVSLVNSNHDFVNLRQAANTFRPTLPATCREIRRFVCKIGIIALAGMPGHPDALAEGPQPDVLLIMIDDMNDWVGVLGGNSQAITPNIDALAARGMVFTNAHAVSTACLPSRTAMLTGVSPFISGVYDQTGDWRDVEAL